LHSSSNLLSNYFPGTLLPGVPKEGVVLKILQDVYTASPRLSRKAEYVSELDGKGEFIEEVMHKKEEVAEYLRVSPSTIDRLIRSGQLEVLKIGRSVRITEKALKRFLASQAVKR
jgi:excisionase family DNA binding protein